MSVLSRVWRVAPAVACAAALVAAAAPNGIPAIRGSTASERTAPAAKSTRDPWETGPPPKGWSDSSIPITPDRMLALPAASQDKALAMLADRPFVALDAKSYLALFPDRGYPADKDRRPYLVRGVALNEKTGGFNAEIKGSELLVVFAAPARDTAPRHRALVLLLPRAAARLYVETVTVK